VLDGAERVPDRPGDHDWNWLTYCCERCGATATAVHEGTRPQACEPGVVGITHRAKAARLQELVGGPTVRIPLMTMAQLGRRVLDGDHVHIPRPGTMTGKRADRIIVDDLDDGPDIA
jgi:hypothetical protein